MRLVSVVLVLGVVVGVALSVSAEAPQPPDAGQSEMVSKPAPSWVVNQWINLPEGKQTLDVSDFKGKVLYLCFFQASCPGSKTHGLPTLKALTEHYAGDPAVAFVAVQTAFREFDVNTPEKLAETAERYQLTIPIGHEGSQGRPPQMLIRHKAGGTPWAMIIDRGGTIRHCTHHTPKDQVVAMIDQYKKETPQPAGSAQEGMVGGPAPSWAVSRWINLPEGKESLDIADFKGKVLCLCFFQASCPGSQKAGLPTLQALTEHYAGDPAVAFVAVQTVFRDFDVNTAEKLAETAEHYKLTIPIGHDGGQGQPPQMLIRNKARGTPWVMIIDRDGTIRHSQHFTPKDQVVAMVDQYKKEAPGKPAAGDDTTAKAPRPFDVPEPVELSPAGERLKKRIDDIDKQIVGLLEEEMDLKMGVMNAKQKGMQVVKDTEAAAKEIALGRLTKPLRQYQAIMMACVQKYQAYDGKYAAFQKTLKGMERLRTAKEVQKDLDAVNAQILTRRRSNMDQIAGLLERAGDFKKAVEIYKQLRDLLPKDKDHALERRTLQEKVGAAYENCEEYKSALAAYNVVYEVMSEAERKDEVNLRLKIGNLYSRTGNYKKALEVFKAVKKDLKPGQKVSNLDNVIADLEKRVDA